MKVLDKHKLLKGGQRSQARLERDVLRVVRHPFVARLRLSFQTETRLYLLSDFYCGGCLTEFRRDHEVGKEGARFYVVELALALAYLHAQGVVRSCAEINIVASMVWAPEISSHRARNRKKDHHSPSLVETTRLAIHEDGRVTRNRRRSTATSSRRTCSSIDRATSRSAISASPRPVPRR